jgi:hypothetical protein
MESNASNGGLSNKVKASIIILTLITVGAFGVFFVKLTDTIITPPKKDDRAQYLRAVGDRLKETGLKEQAINQYIKFLDKTQTNEKTRAEVAHTVGKLYMQLSNCREALVWFFEAEMAGPAYPQPGELKQDIDTCTTQVNFQKPQGHTTR